MNLVKPGDKNEWRKQGTIDLTQKAPPTIIKPPSNPEYMRPSTVFGDPPQYPGVSRTLPFGNYRDDDGAPDLEPIDAEKALKDLLNGLNSPTIPKRRSRRKNKKSKGASTENDEDVFNKKSSKHEDDELASLMSKTKLDNEVPVVADGTEDDETDEEAVDEDDEGDEEEEDLAHVDGLKVRLLPHQVDGVQFLLSREEGKQRGGILADDVSFYSMQSHVTVH